VGNPGVGKTTIAKNLTKLLPDIEVIKDCPYHCTKDNPVCPTCRLLKAPKTTKIKGEERFIRIQGSPDLTVEDLLGDIDPIKAMKFGPLSSEAFQPGKIFKANNGVLFFDELNRCPEKLQNGLLQALQEGIVTLGSYDLDLNANFLFIATMNPEDTSTEKLSDVLLDRFDVVYMDYPEEIEIEKKIIKQNAKQLVKVPEDLLHFMVYFVRLLRESKDLEKKPSVRASIGLYERTQSTALIEKKKTADYEDLKNCVITVLAHRISLKPSIKYLMSPADFVKEKFEALDEPESTKEKEGDAP